MEDMLRIPKDKINLEEYFSIFENINEAVCINAKDGTIFFVNNSTLDLFGYSRDEIIGMNIIKLYANPKDRSNIVNVLEKQGFLKDFPVKLKKKNGEIIDCEFNTKIIEDSKNNKIFYGFIRNITERKKIEDKLKESEDRYRTLFENASDSIFLLQNGFFIDCNSKTLNILGYRKEELIGKTPYDISPPLQPDGKRSKTKAKEKIEAALKGIPQFFEWKHIKADGSFIDTEVSLNLINLYEGKYLQAIVRDVTERKRANEIILENEEKFRSIFEATADIITYVDNHGNIIDVNSRVNDILGYERGEIVGKNFRDLKLIDIEQLPSLIKLFIKTIRSGRASEKTEITLRNKNGDKVYFEVATQFINKNQRITGAVSIFRDISDRKKSEEKLRESEEKYRELVENANSIIAKFDKEGRILSMNEFGLKLFGYKEEELIGKTWNETILPKVDSTGKILESLATDIVKDVNKYRVNLNENVKKNGERVWIYWTNKPIMDEKGEITGILSVGTDITDNIRAEKQMERNVEYFAHLVDHIRNPLAILSGFVQVKVTDDDTKARVQRQVDRIEEIIKQLDEGWIDTEETRKFLRKYR